MCSNFYSRISEQPFFVKPLEEEISGRKPVDEVAQLSSEPLETLAVDDQEGADEEDRQAKLSHGVSIPHGRRPRYLC